MSTRVAKITAIAGLLLGSSISGGAAGGDRLLDELVRTRAPGFAYDYAGVMSGAHRTQISRVLEELEAKTGAQVKVVALKSLEGGEVNDFATRLYERWGIGTKGKDDGALLLAAIEDRKVRIEVGYGLEGVIPDALAGRILDTHVLPQFRAGDFGGGLLAGAEAIALAVAADRGIVLGSVGARAPPDAGRGPARDGGPQKIPLPVMILLGILFVYMAIRHPQILIWMLLSSGGGRGGGGGFGGSGFGGFGGGRSGGGGASRGW